MSTQLGSVGSHNNPAPVSYRVDESVWVEKEPDRPKREARIDVEVEGNTARLLVNQVVGDQAGIGHHPWISVSISANQFFKSDFVAAKRQAAKLLLPKVEHLVAELRRLAGE